MVLREYKKFLGPLNVILKIGVTCGDLGKNLVFLSPIL